MHLLAQLLPHSPSGKYLTKKTVPAKNFKSSTMRLQGFMGKCLSALQIQRIFFLEETITTFSNLRMHISRLRMHIPGVLCFKYADF